MTGAEFPDSMQSPHERDLIWQQAVVRRDCVGKSWLEFPEAGNCARCLAGKGCGAGLFSRLFGARRQILPLTLSTQFRSGQSVQAGIDARTLLRVAAVLYLLPVLAFIAGAGAAHLRWPGHDSVGLLAGVGLAGLVWLLGSRRQVRGGLARIKVRAKGLESWAIGNHLNGCGWSRLRNPCDPACPDPDPSDRTR
ncbi:MAG: SoxR reducing system RseC family protein [Xanthomonadaceae bacterium]|nr:SoxR reducing system RseC family protein [Xanthomonadaceae bacterium]